MNRAMTGRWLLVWVVALAVVVGCDSDDGSDQGVQTSSSSGTQGTVVDSGQETEEPSTSETDNTETGDESGTEDEPAEPECTGVAELASTADAPDAGQAPECAIEAGCAAPEWLLDDFQPASCGYEAIYGLDSFRGTPTLVVLLAAWCSFCRLQIEKLEQLKFELEADGVDIDFVVVNMPNAVDDQEEFVNRATFPLFQDTEEVDAYGLHQGSKDDFYLYDAGGSLLGYYEVNARDFSLNLTTDEGYANLDGLLREAAGAQ